MKAECASATLVTNYHSIWRNFPEDCTLHLAKTNSYRTGQALGAPEVWDFQNFQTVGKQMCQCSQPYTSAASSEISLALSSVRGWVVDPKATVRPEGLSKWHVILFNITLLFQSHRFFLAVSYLIQRTFKFEISTNFIVIRQQDIVSIVIAVCAVCRTVEESWFNSRQVQEVFSFTKRPGATQGTGSPCLGHSWLGVKLTTHLHQIPRLRMSGATTPLPHTSWRAQGQVYLFGNMHVH